VPIRPGPIDSSFSISKPLPESISIRHEGDLWRYFRGAEMEGGKAWMAGEGGWSEAFLGQ
jgi:hypothetical protein